MIQRLKSDIHIKELLKGSAINIFFKIFSVVAQYLLFWVIAKYYQASGVGIFSIVWTVLQVVTVFSKLGFDTAIVKLIATYFSTGKEKLIPKLYLRIAILIVIAALFYSGLLALNSVWISNLYFESTGNSKYILIICLAVLPLSLQYVNADAFKALKEYTLYSAFQNGSIFILSLIFIVLIHSFYPGVDAIVYGLVSAVFILFAFSTVFIRRVFRKLIKNYSLIVSELKFKISGSKSLLKMSLPMMLSNSLFLILNWTDTLMLGAFVSDSEVGIYNMALKIAALNTIVLVGVNAIAMPKYAELNACENKDSLKKFMKNTTLFIILLSVPVLSVIFIFPELLLGMFGEEFKIGVSALLILSVGQIISSFSSTTINLLNMTGKEISVRNILLGSVFFNMIFNYIMIPIYGINGAAIATATSTILWNLLAVIVLYRNYGFTPYPTNIRIFKRKK